MLLSILQFKKSFKMNIDSISVFKKITLIYDFVISAIVSKNTLEATCNKAFVTPLSVKSWDSSYLLRSSWLFNKKGQSNLLISETIF